MNWIMYGIELVALIVCFALVVTIPITINPVSFISDYPPEIQEEYYRSQKREKNKESLTKAMVIKKVVFLIAAIFLCAWMAYLAGADTFLQGTILSFSYVVAIAAFDTFIIDWIFFPRIKRWRLPGTEHMDRAYRQKWFHLKGVLVLVPMGAVFAVITGGIMVWLF